MFSLLPDAKQRGHRGISSRCSSGGPLSLRYTKPNPCRGAHCPAASCKVSKGQAKI